MCLAVGTGTRKLLPMNRLSLDSRAQILGMLVEGASLRAASCMADVSINTVSKLLVDVGTACAEYQDRTLRNLTCRRIQCDEIWSFVYAKQKNVPAAKAAPGNAGDVWTWVALDAETKLVASWMVGTRDLGAATEFMQDLAGRLASRVQLTTDGHHAYLNAVEDAFGADIDFAQLRKIYASEYDCPGRYSPPAVVTAKKHIVKGEPDPAHISTSHAERQNLSMRMGMGRFTRLTNGFSKKLDNHVAAVALYFQHYNFARIHKTLRVTPAMASRVADHVWSLQELARLAD